MRRPAELLRALAVLAEPPTPAHAALAEALELPAPPTPSDYSDLFVFQLYPYASVYLGAEGMMGGEAADRIAGFWRALGRTPPPEPDHLAALLGLYAELIDDAAVATAEDGTADSSTDTEAALALRREAASVLVREHLAPWVFAWLDRIDELAAPFHRAWAALLSEALRAEMEATGGPAPEVGRHLAAAAPLADPRVAEASDFAPALLAHARSGAILTRADLARMSRELGCGLRAGERRYALEQLLAVDPAGALAWIAREAERQAAMHRGRTALAGGAAQELAVRAGATARLCRELAEGAGEAEAGSGSAQVGAGAASE